MISRLLNWKHFVYPWWITKEGRALSVPELPIVTELSSEVLWTGHLLGRVQGEFEEAPGLLFAPFELAQLVQDMFGYNLKASRHGRVGDMLGLMGAIDHGDGTWHIPK